MPTRNLLLSNRRGRCPAAPSDPFHHRRHLRDNPYNGTVASAVGRATSSLESKAGASPAAEVTHLGQEGDMTETLVLDEFLPAYDHVV